MKESKIASSSLSLSIFYPLTLKSLYLSRHLFNCVIPSLQWIWAKYFKEILMISLPRCHSNIGLLILIILKISSAQYASLCLTISPHSCDPILINMTPHVMTLIKYAAYAYSTMWLKHSSLCMLIHGSRARVLFYHPFMHLSLPVCRYRQLWVLISTDRLGYDSNISYSIAVQFYYIRSDIDGFVLSACLFSRTPPLKIQFGPMVPIW